MLKSLWSITIVAIVAALSAFVASFFLPAIEGFAFIADSGPTLNGWEAFIAMFWTAPLAAFFSGESAAWLLLYAPLVNVLFLLSSVVVVAAPRHAAILGAVLLVCGVGIVVVVRRLDVALYVGFYVWAASFFVMSLGCIMASICCILGDAHRTREMLRQTKNPGLLGSKRR